MMKTGSVATKIALAATLTATTVPACGLAFADVAQAPQEAALAAIIFPDVDETQWYAAGVAYAVENGLMSGYAGGDRDGYFGVYDVLTRGQLATVLWRAACPEEAAAYDMGSAVNTSAMADLEDGEFYTAAANWAAENGVINGFEVDGRREFRPYDAVSMEQLCCIVANFRGESYGASALSGQAVEGFADGWAVSSWAAGSVSWAAKHGWVSGYEVGAGARELRPWEALSRGRAATILENSGVLDSHEHEWTPVYRIETTSYEVVDQAAWDEPVYTQQEREICNGCGADLTGTDPYDHIESQVLAGNYACGGFHTTWVTVCTGSTHHDAVAHTETTSQQVLDHYECSGCGARKE